jgi:hypothetical protein
MQTICMMMRSSLLDSAVSASVGGQQHRTISRLTLRICNGHRMLPSTALIRVWAAGRIERSTAYMRALQMRRLYIEHIPDYAQLPAISE